MQEFIIQHKALAWVICVVFATGLLLVANRYSFAYLRKRMEKKGKKNFRIIKSLRRVLKSFFISVGIVLVSYVFFEKAAHQFITENLIRIIWIGLVAIVTIVSAAVAQTFFENKIETTSRRDQRDTTTYKYLNYLSVFFIYLFGSGLMAVAIPPLRNFAASALAGAGVFALIIGVAAQEAFSNLIGGLFIAFFKPFRIGDVIRIGDGTVWRVEDLTLRHTNINNFQNKRVIIPNAVINKENIINFYLGEYKICEWVEVGISYDSDIDHAIALIQEEAEKHPHLLDNRTPKEKEEGKPKVDVQVVGLGDSSVNLKAWVWAASFQTGFKMRNDLFKAIKQRFDLDGIEIPFPHKVLVQKNWNLGLGLYLKI